MSKKHLAVISWAGFTIKVSEVVENRERVFFGSMVGNTSELLFRERSVANKLGEKNQRGCIYLTKAIYINIYIISFFIEQKSKDYNVKIW